jgi:hypothetical protein
LSPVSRGTIVHGTEALRLLACADVLVEAETMGRPTMLPDYDLTAGRIWLPVPV